MPNKIGVTISALRPARNGLEILMVERGKPPNVNLLQPATGVLKLSESIMDCARRTLKSECDVDLPIGAITKSFYATNHIEDDQALKKDNTPWVFIHLAAFCPKDQMVIPNGKDTIDCKWVPLADLYNDTKANPDKYAPELEDVVYRFRWMKDSLLFPEQKYMRLNYDSFLKE